MENCKVSTLSEDQQANLSKLPFPVNRGHGAGQKVELLWRRFCKKKGLCISPKKPRPGRWHRMLQSEEKELGNTFSHMDVTLTETSTQRTELQCMSLMVGVPWDGWYSTAHKGPCCPLILLRNPKGQRERDVLYQHIQPSVLVPGSPEHWHKCP